MPVTGNIAVRHYLLIDSRQTVSGLQKKFNLRFPFLKIEFFSEPCDKGRGASKNKMVKTDIALSALQRIKRAGKISFSDHTTVANLEETFLKRFGLCMQVFRKSGNVWLETSATDNWTLKQQNEEGKSLAEHLKTEVESADDHDMY